MGITLMRIALIIVLVGVSIASCVPIVASVPVNGVVLAQQTGATGLGLANEIAAVAQTGVATALLLVIKWAHQEKTEMRAAQIKREEQWSEWEKIRHVDSVELNGTLRDMSVHCAETMGKK